MTINSSQYIQNIDRSGATPTVDEEFTVPFRFDGEEELIVWTIVDTLFIRKRVGKDYLVLGSVVRWIGLAPSDDMRLQRHVSYSQPNRLETATSNSVEKSVDDLCKKNQQQIKPDQLDPRHFDAEGDSIENVKEGSSSTRAVNKKQVDDSFGVDAPTHNNWTLSSGDVNKYLTVDSSGNKTWSSFSGTPDPRGEEGKYLTVGGWQGFGKIPTPSGSSYLLKDVGGFPTWSDAGEYPPGSSFGQILSRDGVPAAAWRNSGYTPTPLTHKRYSTVRARASDAANEWKGKFFFTDHLVAVDNNSGCFGGGEWMGPGVLQHRVWIGSISHTNGLPSFVMATPTGTTQQQHNISPYIVGSPNRNLPIRRTIPQPMLVNLLNVTSTTVEVAVSTFIHRYVITTEASSGAFGNYMWGDGTLGTSEDQSPVPTSLTTPITLMWYFE